MANGVIYNKFVSVSELPCAAIKKQKEQKNKFEIINQVGESLGIFNGCNEDPRFHIFEFSDQLYKELSPGYKISFFDDDISITQKETREIKAVLIDIYGLLCIAPKIIDKKPRWNGNPLISGLTGGVKEVRPGCKILGGRNSGFYDEYGIILENKWLGGDVNKFEDWMFYVLSPNGYTANIVPSWILLDDITKVVSSPEFSVNFDELNDKEILQLLENSNSEILEYYHNHPEKIEAMNARYFEHFIKSVYINNGFAVEKVGKWNQADGGIDLIAISKFINNEIKILIQCKTSINKISAKPVRELNGVLDVFKAHKGIVATTSRFTKDAIEEVNSQFWKIGLEDIDTIMLQLASLFNPEFSKMINKYGKLNS